MERFEWVVAGAPRPLDGLRVLEIGGGRAVAYCGRLLAGFGADVTLLAHDEAACPSERRGTLGAWFDYAKQCAGALDDLAADRLAALAASVDVLITDLPRDEQARRLGAGVLARESLIRVELSDFGPDGPLAGCKGNELVLQALSGFLGFTGPFDAPPAKYGVDLCWLMQGSAAAYGVLVAAWERIRSGRGQVVDVAGLDLATWSQAVFPLLPSFTGVVARRSGKTTNPDTGLYPTKDGDLLVVVGRDGWDRLVAMLERPDLLDDAFRNTESRQVANKERTLEVLNEAFSARPTLELFHAAQALRLPFGPVQAAPSVLACEQLDRRRFFDEHEGRRLPGRPFLTANNWWRGPGDSSRTDQGVAASHDWLPESMPWPAPTGLPLAGIRVIELTTAWSAPLAGKLLADLGADVLKVESGFHPDIARGGNLTDYAVREEFWDEFGHFLMANTSKAHCCMELSDERSRALFKQLVRNADVVIQNFPPRVLEQLGLGYAALREENPALIMASTCAFGHTGPWSSYTGLGWTIEAAAGITDLTGHPGGPPVLSLNPFPDMASAMHLAIGVMCGLHRRRRTGEGEWIDLSQYEMGVTATAPRLLEYQETGEAPARLGNRHPRFAPHNIYPAASDGTGLGGDDNWVAVAVETDAEWQALCAVVGSPSLCRAEWLTAAGRKAAEAEIDALLAAWTRGRTAEEAAVALQARGVRAAPVARYDQVLRNPQLWHRGFLQRVEHHLIGPRIVTGACQRFARTPGGVRWAAPRFGQQNEYILREVLGLSPDEMRALQVAGLTDTFPRGLMRPGRGAIPFEVQCEQGMARGRDPGYQVWNAAGEALPLSTPVGFAWPRRREAVLARA